MPVDYIDDLQGSLAELGQVGDGPVVVGGVPDPSGPIRCAGHSCSRGRRPDLVGGDTGPTPSLPPPTFVARDRRHPVQPRPRTVHQAAADQQTVISDSLGGDQRWPQFGSQVARLGRAQCAVPTTGHRPRRVGCDEYLRSSKARVHRATPALLGELFAVPAAIAVQNAQVLAQTKRLANQLQSALSPPRSVERAVGIMMSRSGGTPAQARPTPLPQPARARKAARRGPDHR